MNPATHVAAAAQARELMRRGLRGVAPTTARRHRQRAGAIAETIWRHWQTGIWRWKQKHIRWYLEVALSGHSPATRYQHFLTVRGLLRLTGRERWEAHLVGDWQRPSGVAGALLEGRPARIKKAGVRAEAPRRR